MSFTKNGLLEISNKGSRIKVSIFYILKKDSSTPQELYDVLRGQWELKEIKNALAHMVSLLEISRVGKGKNATYTLRKLGENYLEKFIHLLSTNNNIH